MISSKPRRWQVGEHALCSCPDRGGAGVCVAGCGPDGVPSVELGGAVHACATAVLARVPVGRPRKAPAVRVSPISADVAAEMRRVIAQKGMTEREFLEAAVSAEAKRYE